MRHKKNIIIGVMCIAVLIMGLGYALLSTQIDISGSTAVTSTWKIEFSDIRTKELNGGATNVVAPIAQGTSASFEVDLVLPGDYVLYEIDITNYGDIDAEVKGATYSISGTDAIYVYVSGIKKGTKLPSCEGLDTCPTITLTLKVGYDQKIVSEPIDKRKDIEFNIEIGQFVEENPTPETDLIPELSISTLVDNILNNNTAYVDNGASKFVGFSTGIDFGKTDTYISSYDEKHDTTATSVSFGSTTKYYFATSYTFNASEGTYKLAGTITNGTWSSKSSTYSTYPYTCRSTSSTTSCNTLYKMNSYTSTTAGTAYKYTKGTAHYSNDNGQGLYYTSTNTEGNKTTYYFRGNVQNNYVEFGNILWRIVRINEDGSIRIVTQESIQRELFSDYLDEGALIYGDSNVKVTLDNWYVNNLSNYSNYLADAGFCNDRSVDYIYEHDDGTSEIEYEAYDRLANKSKPQFACPNMGDDLYTTSSSTKGNKLLTYPIGLLTADEIVYAGALYGYENEGYYLNNDDDYWTMTPANYYTSTPLMHISSYPDSVSLTEYPASDLSEGQAPEQFIHGVRPVINLKSTVTLSTELPSGCTKLDGTEACPYIIKTN